VDVEGLEDFQDWLGRDAPFLGPDNDVEVFLPFLEAVEDAVQKKGFVNEATLQQAEDPAIQFDPEALALKVLQPGGWQVAPPVTLHPAANGRLAEVVASPLALNPFEAHRLLLAVHENACLVHGHHGWTPRSARGGNGAPVLAPVDPRLKPLLEGEISTSQTQSHCFNRTFTLPRVQACSRSFPDRAGRAGRPGNLRELVGDKPEAPARECPSLALRVGISGP